MTIEERITDLAAHVIQVLDAQKKYFKTRCQEDLIASKQLESALRKEAVDILAGRLF